MIPASLFAEGAIVARGLLPAEPGAPSALPVLSETCSCSAPRWSGLTGSACRQLRLGQFDELIDLCKSLASNGFDVYSEATELCVSGQP